MIKGEKNNIDLSFEDMQFLLALYETQSLTQTAGDMRLSMGAASRRLSHVREVFGDELFVRSGLSMLPTSRMRELRDRLAELVDQTRRLLNPEPLELHEMNRVVRFISADNGIATLLSAAVERFYNAVPNSRFAIEPLDVRGSRGFAPTRPTWHSFLRRNCRPTFTRSGSTARKRAFSSGMDTP